MKTVDRAHGRWQEILPLLGIDTRFLVNKHGPCPLCGGKDRFRWDDKDGTGSYYCGQCGPGQGLLLVQKLHKWDYATACREVDQIIGLSPPVHKAAPERKDDRAARLAKIEGIIADANRPAIVRDYLASRGLSTMPDVLRGHPALPYSDGGQFRGRYPAVIAPIMGLDETLRSCLRIYVADVPTRKKIMPTADTIRGAAVRLFDPGEDLGVAEGVETAIAAHELFDVPTWAALSTAGIEAFQPPAGVRRLVIFADHDTNYAGQKAAYILAQRLSRHLTIEVSVPPAPDTDWLDVLNERAGNVTRTA